MITRRDSPLFSATLLWLKRKDFRQLKTIFPALEGDIWRRRLGQGRYFRIIKLIPIRNAIFSELADPLFLKSGVNIKDEDKARKDNLFSLTETLYRDLNNENKELQKTVADYHRDLRTFFPQIRSRPLYWVFRKSDSQYELEYNKSIKELTEKIRHTWEACKKLDGAILDRAFQDWRRFLNERDEAFLEKRHVELPEIKRRMAIYETRKILAYLRAARGKPGRHPRPFNVFVYHLINRCTKWKFDKNRRYVMRRDGQHRLERDWDLILFLLLDTHVHRVSLPDLERFISKNARTPATEVLQILKKTLWDTYKNFPPQEGWSFPRRLDKTGFKKLIVGDDGKLQIVQL
jgi:hypothetical protein